MSTKLLVGTKERIRSSSTIRFSNQWFSCLTQINRSRNGVGAASSTSHRLTLELRKVPTRLCGSVVNVLQFFHDDQVLLPAANSSRLSLSFSKMRDECPLLTTMIIVMFVQFTTRRRTKSRVRRVHLSSVPIGITRVTSPSERACQNTLLTPTIKAAKCRECGPALTASKQRVKD